MRAFAQLLENLVYAPGRNTKLALLTDYFRARPDPERGIALGALTGDLKLRQVRPSAVRALVAEKVDPILFELSYDYVGDMAETVALIWPAPDRPANRPPDLAEIVAEIDALTGPALMARLAEWLDRLDASERFALLKLITGGLRVGVSGRLARTALAALGAVDVAEVEEVWHAQASPYAEVFAWLEGRADRPSLEGRAVFRPPMLAHPLDGDDPSGLDPAAFAAEWKWDGVRVQVCATATEARLYSRTGDDLGGAFPDVVAAVGRPGVWDGELLIGTPGASPRPFGDLQTRLGRKKPGKKIMADKPAFVRLYDVLMQGEADLRGLPFRDRRARLEADIADHDPDRFDLSPLVPFGDWDTLADLRAAPPDAAIEGLMLKRWDSTYVGGRPKGPWFKWKRAAQLADCVLMYAQRGHGKRSSYYSDFTFGAWADDGRLVPVGKAYFGFTDAELAQLDKWVRQNTTHRFGPVREVAPALVVEVAFDAIQTSTRHKSGLAMRFPRLHRIRWDKPPSEADRVATLKALAPG